MTFNTVIAFLFGTNLKLRKYFCDKRCYNITSN